MFEPVRVANSRRIATVIGFSGIEGTWGLTTSLGAAPGEGMLIGFGTEGIPGPPEGIP